MNRTKKPQVLIRATETKLKDEPAFSHPLNPKSEVRGVELGDPAGMQRLGVSLVLVSPGKEAFIYHSHKTEEEFIYILSGRGIAEIDDREHEVGPGDFMGFATPSIAHHLRNPFAEDLVYLMGRERKDFEFTDFPRVGKHIIRVGNRADIVDRKDLHEFWRDDEAE